MPQVTVYPIMIYNHDHDSHLYKNSLKISKEVIRIRRWKKNRQHNDQKKKYKTTNNDLQNINIKLKIG